MSESGPQNLQSEIDRFPGRELGNLYRERLTAAHRIAAVVAQVAIAVAYGERTAVVAGRCIRLEASKLGVTNVTSQRRIIEQSARSFERFIFDDRQATCVASRCGDRFIASRASITVDPITLCRWRRRLFRCRCGSGLAGGRFEHTAERIATCS